jgi:hypothetical protein
LAVITYVPGNDTEFYKTLSLSYWSLVIIWEASANEKKNYYRFQHGSRENAVDIAMGWTAVMLSRAVARYFSLLHTIQTGFGAQPTSCTMGIGGSLWM